MAKTREERYELRVKTTQDTSNIETSKLKQNLENLLNDSLKEEEELASAIKSDSLRWKEKECVYKKLVDDYHRSLQGLMTDFESFKKEIQETLQDISKEMNIFERKIQDVASVAQNYYLLVVEENNQLNKELQDMKDEERLV